MGRKTARMIAGLGAFGTGYLKGQQLAREANKARREQDMIDDLAGVDKNFTPTQTEVAGGDEALMAAQEAKANALATAADDVQRQQVETDYAPTINALEARKATPASVAHSVGTGTAFRQQAEPFDPNQIAGAKTQARADIYSAAGREDDAARVLMNEQRRRALADDTAVREAFNPPRANANLLANSPTDLADAIHGNAVPTSTSGPAGVIAKAGIPGARNELDWYLKDQAPKITQALLKGGHVEHAKRFTDFLESREGYEYAKAYTVGMRRWAVGDNEGAIHHFEKLYNDDLFPDGRKVKLTPIDGDQLRIDQIDAEGKVLGSKTGSLADLTKQAALALNPLKAVEFMAQQNAKREGEAATLDRQVQLETLRQQGREVAEDRRDERLGMRLDAQGKQLERRLAQQADGGGLTQAQQRGNFEIDAAREMITGLSPDEIRDRTQQYGATGRINDSYDPGLARQVALANRRKIGQDDVFDARTGRQPEPPAASPKPAPAKPAGTPIERARAAMAADPNMAGFNLGAQVLGKGFKVLDQDGKHVGWYGAAR